MYEAIDRSIGGPTQGQTYRLMVRWMKRERYKQKEDYTVCRAHDEIMVATLRV